MPVRMCVGCREMKNKDDPGDQDTGRYIYVGCDQQNGRGSICMSSEKCCSLPVRTRDWKGHSNRLSRQKSMNRWKRRWKHLKPDKALSMLGLAARAGRIVSGEFTVEKEVKSGRAYLVLIAEDASENTRKKFQNMCEFYEVPMRLCYDRERLGHFIGKDFRASVAILDEGFADNILKHLNSQI